MLFSNAVITLLIILSGLGLSFNPKLDHFILHDGYFYAVAKNRYEIVKLDRKGNTLTTSGRRGRGPGEFSTAQIQMTFTGDTLCVYDGIAKRLTYFDEDLNIVKEQFPKENIVYLISYKKELFGVISVLQIPENENDEKLGIKTLQEIGLNRHYKIAPVGAPQNVLASYHFKSVNPVFSLQKVRSNGKICSIFFPYQNKFRIYYKDRLRTFSLQSLEPLALGKKMDVKSEALYPYKDYPYFPVYKLVENVLLPDDHSLNVQVQSYKQGEQLLFYDLDEDEITQTIPSPEGTLIGRDRNYFYFYHNREIKKYTLTELKQCAYPPITFYISTFGEQCYFCKQQFFKLYGVIRDYNIPYHFVVKDPNWISAPGEDNYREVVNAMYQWHVWGAVRFTDDCDDCFEGDINMRIGLDGKVISLPDTTTLSSKIACME